jgi:hypothetical protein
LKTSVDHGQPLTLPGKAKPYQRSEGPELTHRISFPAPGERLFESSVLIDYQCRQPVFS